MTLMMSRKRQSGPMTLFAESATLLKQIHEETKNIRSGEIPSIYVLMGFQDEVLRLYTALGEELSERFSSKELAYLKRKVAVAKEHQRGRMKLAMTSKDAEMSAIVAAEQLQKDEIEAMTA